MKKEMLIAVIVGLIFGLIITLGAYRARNTQLPDQVTPVASPTPSPSGDTGNLAVHSPEDEVIVDNETITIAGTTAPNLFVGIFVNDDITVTTADSSGSFSVDRTLEPGSNVVVVQAIAEDGTVSKIERTVIFSTVDFELETATPSASPEL